MKEEGIGQELEDPVKVVEQMVQRGLSVEEAQAQYAAELKLFRVFDSDSWLTYAPNMKISYGTVGRE